MLCSVIWGQLGYQSGHWPDRVEHILCYVRPSDCEIETYLTGLFATGVAVVTK